MGPTASLSPTHTVEQDPHKTITPKGSVWGTGYYNIYSPLFLHLFILFYFSKVIIPFFF